MNKKLFALVIVFVLLSLIFSGCTRSATKKSPTDATPTTEIAFPVATMDTSARLTEIVQQTQNAISTPVIAPTVNVPHTGNTPVATATTSLGLPTQALPTPTRANVVIPTLTRPATYTLQQGEWPICIARRYNLDLDSFLVANDMTLYSSPPSGTVLVIPSTGTWSAGDRALKPHPTDYTVVTGDTIYSIACDFGDVDPMAITLVNGIKEPYTLSVGSVIQIP